MSKKTRSEEKNMTTATMNPATYAKTLKAACKPRHTPYVFSSLERARSFASHAVKPMWVVLADYPTAVVVCPADAARLERAGYEIA
jgi:hypothetical protein